MPQPGDLVAFDVDGTLVEHPEGQVVWQILNRRFVGDDAINALRYQQYREGEITYAEWVALDVEGWRSARATRAQVFEALAGLRPTAGARETLDELRQRGYRLAIISGTLDVTLEHCLPDLGIEEAHFNRLHFAADGTIAGYHATPYDMDGKARCLLEIAGRLELPIERTTFVGDHVNDLEAVRVAGFSIAWNPRSAALEDVASVIVRGQDMRTILRYFPA